MALLRLLIVCAFVVTSASIGDSDGATSGSSSLRLSDPASKRHHQAQETHWAVRLGMRSLQVDHAFPTVDRVVLVPDAATYVDELSEWSPAGRWPVLIEDDRYAPMFIRRFAPAEVIRRESIGHFPNGRSEREALLAQIPVRAWGGDPARATLRDVFESHQYEPPGIVIASADDPAWTAAIALAAGRGQPLLWLDDAAGRPGDALDRHEATELAAKIESLIEAEGWPYQNHGDAIETITLCRAIAGRVNLPRPDNGEIEPAAITDFLGRNEDGSRFAHVGWIFGDEIRSAYVAMSSIFLGRESIRLYNAYPAEQAFQNWRIKPAGGLLAQRGFEVTTFTGAQAREDEWAQMIQSGVKADVLVVNTRGQADYFDLLDARATVNDVPMLNVPAVVHFTHSWSMRSPEDESTIAGRFLESGAYAYVGSVQEPDLEAFIQPLALADRWASLVPVLVGARHWDDAGIFGGPWKVNMFGDPLMTAVPQAVNRRDRIAAPADEGTNLNDLVRKTMREIEDDESGVALANAIVLLERIGRDDIAVQLWRLAQQRGIAGHAADPALGPLFRKGEPEEFLHAWRQSGRRDAIALNMLWHKIAPILPTIDDEETLELLQQSIRRPHAHRDVSRLAPHLSRVFGNERARDIIDQELKQTDDRRAQNELRSLLREY